MNESVARHCDQLNRCNQRGGRMLSVFDLLADDTLDLDLAAYLIARISRGASFMVGAVPGGAGKTTVMCALLNFVPADVSLIAATPEVVYDAAERKASHRACYICHEIGSGYYYAYLWSDALVAYCGLSQQGHMLATNLHADDIDQARNQICGTNGVPINHFNRFELLIFLRVDGGYFKTQRRIDRIYSSDGSSEHVEVTDLAIHADSEWVAACRGFLRETMAGAKTIEQTRSRVLEFLGSNSS